MSASKQKILSLSISLLLGLRSELGLGQDRAVRPAFASGAGRRLALLIGNKDYSWAPLQNPLNDVDAMARTLTGELGFAAENVVVVRNGKRREMNEATIRLINRVQNGDVVVFYYSGHGTVYQGENYLVPVDFEGQPDQLQYDAFSANRFLDNLQNSGAAVKILILDACRSQAVPGARGNGVGLGQMAGRGTLVMYATELGKTADDNSREANGLFTKYLLEGLRTPGKTAMEVFQSVARGVYSDAGGRKQLPWIGGVMLEDFYFKPDSEPARVFTDKPKELAVFPKLDLESEYFAECKQGTMGACNAYLVRYPQGQYAALALQQIRPTQPTSVAENRVNTAEIFVPARDPSTVPIEVNLDGVHSYPLIHHTLTEFHKGVLTLFPTKLQWIEDPHSGTSEDNFSVECPQIEKVKAGNTFNNAWPHQFIVGIPKKSYRFTAKNRKESKIIREAIMSRCGKN